MFHKFEIDGCPDLASPDFTKVSVASGPSAKVFPVLNSCTGIKVSHIGHGITVICH